MEEAAALLGMSQGLPPASLRSEGVGRQPAKALDISVHRPNSSTLQHFALLFPVDV